MTDTKMQFHIKTLWDSTPIKHQPVEVTLTPDKDGVKLEIRAPFFNDPHVPSGEPGKPFFKLWEYEVVEAFFLNDKDQYLELEFGAHGHHLGLIMNGRLNLVEQELPMDYHASIDGDQWYGVVVIPTKYFPPCVTRFNAYAIHGTEPKRDYEALYPVPKGKRQVQDFHDLEAFQAIDFAPLLPANSKEAPSKHWTFN